MEVRDSSEHETFNKARNALQSPAIPPAKPTTTDTIAINVHDAAIKGGDVVQLHATPKSVQQQNPAKTQTTLHTTATPDATTAPTKRPYKRKAIDSVPSGTNTPSDTPKEKKPRKPRTTDPNGVKPGPKPKGVNATPSSKANTHTAPRMTPGTDNVQPQTHATATVTPRTSINVSPRPTNSGQRYDPVRELTEADIRAIKESAIHEQQSSAPVLAPGGSDGLARTETVDKLKPIVMSASSVDVVGQSVVSTVKNSAESSGQALEKKDTTGPSAVVKENGKVASTVPTPKYKRATPPISAIQPSRSGLLSSSDLFGGSASAAEKTTGAGVNIDIQITLDLKGGNTINIAQEIIKRYGREALDPRATAHRERLLQVAAAANQLDQGSDDDVSVDLSEPENDSNVEPGAGRDDKSAAGSNSAGEKVKKRARRKAEDYDKEDDFIDDAETAWEQKAQMIAQGFFVYAGPLNADEEPKADGSVASNVACG